MVVDLSHLFLRWFVMQPRLTDTVSLCDHDPNE